MHIELDKNYVKDNLISGNIEVPYSMSVDSLAEIMT